MSRPYLIFIVFALAHFLSYFFRTANAVIAEDLSQDFSLSPAELGFMTSLFFFAFAAAQLPLGAALDRYGSRWATPVLMLAGVAGSLIFAFAPSYPILALGRALIGLGTAGILMGALKAFSSWFPAKRFASVSGTLVAIGSSGSLVAATPLVWFNLTFGWRPVFQLGALCLLLSALAIMFFSRNSPSPSAVVSPHTSIGSIFRSIRFWRIALLNFALAGTMFAYQALWAGPYLLQKLQLDELTKGNLLFLMGIGVIIGYLLSGLLADRFGLKRMTTVAAAVFTLVQPVLAFYVPSWPFWPLGLLFIVFGLTGAFSMLLFTHVRRVFPLHMTGRAVTAVNLFGFGGAALLQWLLGILIGAFGEGTAGGYPPAAYTAAFLSTTLVSGLALLFYVSSVSESEPEGLVLTME